MTGGRITVAFQYALSLYDKMVELSRLEPASTLLEYGYPADDPENVRIFRGYINKAGSSVGMSLSSQGTGMRILHATQSITQLKMGGPTVESVYILNYRLTREQYQEYQAATAKTSRRIAPTKYDQLIDQLTRITSRCNDLETRVKELEGYNARQYVRGSETLP